MTVSVTLLRPTRLRVLRVLRVLLALTLVVTTLGAVATPSPARAVTSYTWTGAVSNAWGNPQNWSPSGTPTTGDSVSIGPSSARNLTDVPDVQLAQLSVSGDPDHLVSFAGPGHVIVGNLQWTGGDIDVDLTVSAPLGDPLPSVISPMQTPLRFGGGDDRQLTLTSNVQMPLGLGAGTAPWLQFMFDASMRIASTGTLALDTGAYLLSNRCCTNNTSTVVVDGRLVLAGATGHTARLEQLGLDWAGEISVPSGNTLQLVGGPVRVGGHAVNGTVGDASLTGGGTFEVTETDGSGFQPLQPLQPDGTMKFLDVGETLSLADASVLRLGPFATTSGVGRVTGDGRLQLAGASIRGELVVDAGVPASTVAGTTSRLALWDPAVRGQYGVLTPRGGLTVVPTSTLRVDSRTRLSVPDGAQLHVQGGSSLSAGGCCTSLGQVVLAPTARLRVGGGSSAPAEVKWFALSGAGEVYHVGPATWDVPSTALTAAARITGTGAITGDYTAGPATVMPIGVLTVRGDYRGSGAYRPTLPASGNGTVAPSRLVVTGEARLGGRLLARGTTRFAPNHRVLMLQAGSIAGGFACSVAVGAVLSSTKATVGLRGLPVSTPECLYPAPARLLSATFKGAKARSLELSGAARQVIVEVTVSKAAGSTRLSVSAGKGARSIQVRKGRSVTRTLLLPIGSARRLDLRLGKRAKVVVTRVGWTA